MKNSLCTYKEQRLKLVVGGGRGGSGALKRKDDILLSQSTLMPSEKLPDSLNNYKCLLLSIGQEALGFYPS